MHLQEQNKARVSKIKHALNLENEQDRTVNFRQHDSTVILKYIRERGQQKCSTWLVFTLIHLRLGKLGSSSAKIYQTSMIQSKCLDVQSMIAITRWLGDKFWPTAL